MHLSQPIMVIVGMFRKDLYPNSDVCLSLKIAILTNYGVRYEILQHFIRLKKINKCFSGHLFEKQMRQAGFYFYFLFPQKQMRPLFYFIKKLMRHLFCSV